MVGRSGKVDNGPAVQKVTVRVPVNARCFQPVSCYCQKPGGVTVNVGDIVSVSGCFTKEKFISGRTLTEIERILGFRHARLSNGIAVVALIQLPGIQQFDLAAYSNVPTHRHRLPEGLNIEKIKTNARASWSTSGFERVVKVLPTIRHDPMMNPDVQYPSGQGTPQWIATVRLLGKVVGLVTEYPQGRYIAGHAAGW
jgi:hypothetical protein